MIKRSKSRSTKRYVKYEQHVRLHHWLLNSAAYLSLSPPARAVLVEVMRIYNGKNNGKLALSVREAGLRCNISKNTAARALRELTERGFIEVRTPSSFSLKCRRAAEWTLTEFRNDVTGKLPTKSFFNWVRSDPKHPAPEIPESESAA
jgi:hypothetical protein